MHKLMAILILSFAPEAFGVSWRVEVVDAKEVTTSTALTEKAHIAIDRPAFDCRISAVVLEPDGSESRNIICSDKDKRAVAANYMICKGLPSMRGLAYRFEGITWAVVLFCSP